LEHSGSMVENVLNGEITVLRSEVLGVTRSVVDGEYFPSTFTSTVINGIQKVHEPIGLQIECILAVREERLGSVIA